MRTSLLSILPLALVASCTKPDAAPTTEPVAKAPSAPVVARVAVERVSADKVCMMNNHFMGAPQIPVKVDGKTYYGCCAMCEKRLREDQSVRFSTDPVTKQRVDKATAVIGKLSSGEVLYFENEQSLRRYSAS
jgi:YHS domain-containing protein